MSFLKKAKPRWVKDQQRRVATFPEPIRSAHTHCVRQRKEVMSSERCGCFYCLETFPPTEIEQWVDEDDSGEGQTAICPRCGIDSVIGDRSGVDLGQGFLEEMKKYWF